MSEPDSRRSEVIQSVDAVCRDFEAAWQADKRPDIRVFLDRVEDEQKESLLAKLILLDVAQRRRFGDTPLAARYKTRFPEYAQVINEALGSEDTQTKSLAVTTPYVATPAELNQSAAQVRTKGRENLPLDRVIMSLTDSGLMSREEVEAFLNALPASSRPKDGKELAEALYRQKKLTRFQAQAVYQGKTRGLVVGNYVVLDKIGRGGMGQVYKARHRVMERIVALKVLPSQSTKSEEAVRRFHREVKAAARLTHPNIVTAHDADEAKGVHFLVMEYVEGQDLAALVKERGALPVRQAVNAILQAARGLEYAHKQGIIHRDIKPHNLLMDGQGTVKILDMGLARIEQEMENADAASDDGLTQSGQVMGTLDFMSPEQTLDTKTADARSDVYSLGCTLHYLLTCRSPYQGDTFTKRILAHRNDPIPSLRARRTDVPESLDLVFQKMLAKRPEGRQQTMTQLIGELEGCLSESKLEASADPYAATASLTGPPAHSEDDDFFQALGESVMNQPVELTERFMASSLPPPVVAVSKPQNWMEKHRILLIGLGLAGVFGLLLLGIMVALRTPEGTLIVEVNEPGAKVQVLDAEGKVEVEQTAAGEVLTFSLLPGKRQLRVEKEGFEFFTKEFTLENRNEVVVNAHLEPLPERRGTLRLTVNEQDSQVEVLDAEGKVESRYRSGAEELTIPLTAGSFQILVEKPGFERFETTVSVMAGVDHPLNVTLAAIAHIEESSAPPSTVPSTTTIAESLENESPSTPVESVEGVAPQRVAQSKSVSRESEYQRAVAEIKALGGKRLAQGYKASWSPDGTRIAFSIREEGLGIFDIVSGTMTRLVAPGDDPTWSTGEGKYIAYAVRKGSNNEVWLIEASGGKPRFVGEGGYPTWSSDSSTFFYVSRKEWRMKTVRLDKGNLTIRDGIAPVPWHYPAVSTDGKLIAYRKNSELIIADFITGNVVRSYTLPPGKGLLSSFSFGSKLLGFGGYGVRDSFDLSLMDIETGRVTRLLSGQFTLPVWSPDGSKVAVDLRSSAVWEIWLLDAETLVSANSDEE